MKPQSRSQANSPAISAGKGTALSDPCSPLRPLPVPVNQERGPEGKSSVSPKLPGLAMERQRPQEGTVDRAASSLGSWGSLSQGICHNTSHSQGSHVWTERQEIGGSQASELTPGLKALSWYTGCPGRPVLRPPA